MKNNLPIPTEDQECYVLVEWLTRIRLRFAHIANESNVPVQYRVKLKRKGVSSGFPDYIIFIPKARSVTNETVTLFIEMKRKKGGEVKPAQKDWNIFLNSIGQVARVCLGFSDVKNVVDFYIKY